MRKMTVEMIVFLVMFLFIIGFFVFLKYALPIWQKNIAKSHQCCAITKVESSTFSIVAGPYGMEDAVDGWIVTISDGSKWAVGKRYNKFHQLIDIPIVGGKLTKYLIAYRSN